MKIALGIEYDGSYFYGWQRQRIEPTVQQVLEDALSQVANEQITVQCAGRTDTGVHAVGQVVHFETNAERELHSWLFGLNSNLPREAAVKWVKHVDDDFNARFSAFERTYQYVILNRQARSAVFNQKVTWVPRLLDEKKMQLAANDLIGEHDFNAYRSVHCQAQTSNREIKLIDIKRTDDVISTTIKANAFLHHMVRNIMGVLIEIGLSKQDVTWAKQVLESLDRTQGGVTAPASGLYLMSVKYPENFEIPEEEHILSGLS